MSKENPGNPRKSSKQKEIERLMIQLESAGSELSQMSAKIHDLEFQISEHLKISADQGQRIKQLDYDCAAKQIQIANFMNKQNNTEQVIYSQADTIKILSQTVRALAERNIDIESRNDPE